MANNDNLKGPMECEADGCREPAQYFPMDHLIEPGTPDAAITKARLSDPHRFCDRHYREWEAEHK